MYSLLIKYLICILLCLPLLLFAQNKYDNHWLFGDNPVIWGDTLNSSFVRFSEEPPLIIPVVSTLNVPATCASMSDAAGNLIFYSNGCTIINAKGDTMPNSDSLGRGIFLRVYCSNGMPFSQGALALPHPDSAHLYYLLVLDFHSNPSSSRHVYYNEINMQLESGLGRVTQKNQVLMADTMAMGSLQAARHANGRDWWVIAPKYASNCYRMGLISSKGLQDTFLQCTGLPWSTTSSGGQAVFTPDGKKYLRYYGENGLNIYDFDRETGRLSNHSRVYIPFDSAVFNYNGLAVSPNSRYVYACANRKLYQLDLYASDIKTSRKLVADWKHPDSLRYKTTFHKARLAPDGKIYICGSINSQHLHTIHQPDCPAEHCAFEPYSIALPVIYSSTMPNFPHYRLWPNTSVCSVSTHTPEEKLSFEHLRASPNPARHFFNIALPTQADAADMEYLLSDIHGRPVSTVRDAQGPVWFDVSTMPPGTYFCRVFYQKKWVKTVKVSVVR
jgi:hypothetical protein